MIYMVDCSFEDQDREREWNDWYREHLTRLLSVPGITSAQRFMALDGAQPAYHAIYSVVSPEVFQSPEYAGIKGGNFPPEWRAAITQWRRTVYDGIAAAPCVPAGSCLLVAPERCKSASLDAAGLQWMEPVALEIEGGARGIAVVAQRDLPSLKSVLAAGAGAYVPVSGFVTSNNG